MCRLPVTTSYEAAAGTTLAVAGKGVLENDVVEGAGSLTASLVSGAIHGTVALASDGQFTYTPLTGYVGTDSFAYQAVNGPTHSAVATVTISITASGVLFGDGFNRLTDPGSLSPWVVQTGNWTVAGGVLAAGTNTLQSYGCAYMANNWTNYSVAGRIRFATTNAGGGGLSGRLNPATGARYAAWVFPEGSPGGSNLLRLLKFQTWTNYAYGGSNGVAMAEASLAATGTNWHNLKLAFHENQVAVFYDGDQLISVTDAETGRFPSGGISADLWTDVLPCAMSVDDVVVSPLTLDESYSVPMNATLVVGGPGVLINDTAVYTTDLVSVLTSEPTHGTVSLSTNGGFTYHAGTNFGGSDSFSYQASQGPNNLGTAAVTIVVAVREAPSITSAPSSCTNLAGTEVRFSVTALGALPLSYQWFWNGTNSLSDGGRIGGALSATLVISNALGADAGSYTVVVTDSRGTVTSVPSAELTVIDPVITAQPASRTNHTGSIARFNVQASGTAPGYQWHRNGQPVNGGTQAELILAEVTAAQAGEYSVVVSNGYGNVTSTLAALTVAPPLSIGTFVLDGGHSTIGWNAVPGENYLLQSKNNLNDTNWTPVPPTVRATDWAIFVTNALNSSTQQFYRTILVP